jgi:hypothetical protein
LMAYTYTAAFAVSAGWVRRASIARVAINCSFVPMSCSGRSSNDESMYL